MSAWENERKRRMDKIMDLLEQHPQGLSLKTILWETQMVREVTRQKIQMYMEDLVASGLVRVKDGRFILMTAPKKGRIKLAK